MTVGKLVLVHYRHQLDWSVNNNVYIQYIIYLRESFVRVIILSGI